jgi:single-strand DNA-binding protein
MLEMNKVFLSGNLTRDPDIRYIPSGTAVSEFDIAVSRRYKNKNGETKDETSFINIETWGKTAEFCSQYLKKGRRILVEGRLRQDSWEAQDGTKRQRIRVVADRVQFADFKPGAGAAAPEPADQPAEPTTEAGADKSEGVDDDLPF